MRRHALSALMLLVICSCKPTIDNQNSTAEYFDLKGYFEQETARISKLKPNVEKTVGVNGVLERKTISITNWQHELSAFSDAEINRASWKGLFVASKTDTTQTYLSYNDKVPVREVIVSLRNGKVYKIFIVLRNKNLLYTSVDSLTYCADSYYLVKKQQNIRFLSNKSYLILGKFK
jgi:hypothetical protein